MTLRIKLKNGKTLKLTRGKSPKSVPKSTKRRPPRKPTLIAKRKSKKA